MKKAENGYKIKKDFAVMQRKYSKLNIFEYRSKSFNLNAMT